MASAAGCWTAVVALAKPIGGRRQKVGSSLEASWIIVTEGLS
jgi:hypothetical protein